MTAPRTPSVSLRHFVLFLGAVFAMGSLGIDSMLPSLSSIAHDLDLRDANQAQLIVTSFGLGMGLGSLIGGPFSDQYGRRPVILLGCLFYGAGAVCAMCAMCATSLPLIFAARIIQGIGASFATVAATAWVRDVHSGVAMARIMSFAMTMFAMMPAIAPFMGKLIASLAGWRAIFAVYALFGLVLFAHAFRSIRETLTGERVRFVPSILAERGREVLSIGQVRWAIGAQTMNMASLFSALSSIQPIFDRTFHRAESFPAYFALIAIGIAIAGVLNGKIVSRYGGRKITSVAFGLNVLLSLLVLTISLRQDWNALGAFVTFLIWATGSFFVQGLITGNLNAIALEPVGDLAGIASSLVSSIPMLLATPLAMMVGLALDGGPHPLELATSAFSALGWIAVWRLKPQAGVNGVLCETR